MNKMLFRVLTSLTSVLLLFVAFTAPTFAASSSVANSHHPLYSSYTYYTPSLTNNGNPGWAYFTDTGGRAAAYTDSNGSHYTSQAVWSNIKGQALCDYYVYVPYTNATAYISYGFFTGGSKRGSKAIDQQSTYNFVYLGRWTGVDQVQIANNDGAYGTKIGVGRSNSLEMACL